MNYSSDFSVVQEAPVSLGSEEELAGPLRMAPQNAAKLDRLNTQYVL
jgi:hypothetical protein